jgi:AAA domain/Homeodomain-like domain
MPSRLPPPFISLAAGVKIVNLPDLPEKGDVANYLEVHSGDDLLAEIWKHKQCWNPIAQRDAWRSLFHSYDEIMSAPPVRFAIEGFLQEDGITLIGGLAGHGKTLCMLAMTQALLEGGKLFHHFPVTKIAERVIYLIPEASLGPFSARLKTFHLEQQVHDGRLFCRTLSSPGALPLTDTRLLEAVKGADVFLDTAIRFMVGEENSATEQKVFAETLFNLQRAGARTITGAHHSPKSFGKDSFMTLENVLRGSGDIGAMLATCWGLAQIDDSQNRIFVQNVKPRDFLPCQPFIIQGRPSINETGYFELTEPPGFAGCLADHKSDRKPGRPRVPDKDKKIAEAWRLKQEGMGCREIAEKLGVSKSTVSNWLSEDEEIQ